MTVQQSRGRCAIYTRKSSEEGLDQAFNSLHAQREACEAYILSQRHEGWKIVSATYDDGGFSGGNMERPGLKKLLADISAAKIDIVIVYSHVQRRAASGHRKSLYSGPQTAPCAANLQY